VGGIVEAVWAGALGRSQRLADGNVRRRTLEQGRQDYHVSISPDVRRKDHPARSRVGQKQSAPGTAVTRESTRHPARQASIGDLGKWPRTGERRESTEELATSGARMRIDERRENLGHTPTLIGCHAVDVRPPFYNGARTSSGFNSLL
jgi:hypothetical protein